MKEALREVLSGIETILRKTYKLLLLLGVLLLIYENTPGAIEFGQWLNPGAYSGVWQFIILCLVILGIVWLYKRLKSLLN